MISKSQYIRASQCHKSLWLYKHRKDLLQDFSAESEARMAEGTSVGELAQQLFPGGELIEFDPSDFDGMVERTERLIEQGCKTLYEATMREGGVFASCDILHKGRKGWELYEVKSSTKVKGYHYLDAAIQWHALGKAGLRPVKAGIVHINNQYERAGDLDILQLFTISDITATVADMQGDIPKKLQQIEAMLAEDEPDIDIGPHCSTPFDCNFRHHCWRHIPPQSVFNLYYRGDRFALYQKGIVKLSDLPPDIALTKAQQLQVRASGKRKPIIDKAVIRDFLETTTDPLSYLDFETFMEAVPRFDSQRPYQQVPFQYSLHIEQGDSLSHTEFLAEPDIDPRRAMAERLLQDLPQHGKIVAYNMAFERRVIKELAMRFNDLSDDLMALRERFIDLIVPFRRLGYYHDKMNGSFSLKSIVPALFPEGSEVRYENLSIQGGGDASGTFATLHLVEDPKEVEKIRQDLLAYCRLDTLAMVEIMKKLRAAVE